MLSAALGASLLLVAVGAMVLSAAFGRPGRVSVVGHDAPVNAGASVASDISAHNSPTLVQDPVRPGNLVVSSRIDTPFFSCSLHVSSDGGASWSQTPIPAPTGAEAKCWAPDVAFSADGTLYLIFVTLNGSGNRPHAVWLSTSKDDGRTLSAPREVLGPLAFQVRLAADPVKPGRLFLTWLQAQSSDIANLKFTSTGIPIQAARSDDGGASWSPPVRVSSPARQRVVTPSPVVGPKGELYVLYVDLGQDTLDYEGEHNGQGGPPYPGPYSLVLARSRDGGATWDESLVDDRLVPISRFIVYFPPFPSVAVDRTGRIYAAFHDSRFGDPDVMLWTLRHGAVRWQGPMRVNDTRLHDGTSQYLPKLGVAPDGRLDVLYYDRRTDPANITTRVSLQSSFDQGHSFTHAVALSSRSFDSRIGFGAREGLPDLGSRLGLISEDRFALGAWTDTRAGTPATQKQDIAAAAVAVTAPTRLSDPARYGLRIGALLLGLAGLALLGLWATARRPKWRTRHSRLVELEPAELVEPIDRPPADTGSAPSGALPASPESAKDDQ
ncbi:MAG: glycoside hydrolase [Actinomycetota bacterium]|nr:glycoside hydrolase [Actinomycetota bacterium]